MTTNPRTEAEASAVPAPPTSTAPVGGLRGGVVLDPWASGTVREDLVMFEWYVQVADGSRATFGEEEDQVRALDLAFGAVADLVRTGDPQRIDYGAGQLAGSVWPRRASSRSADIAATLQLVRESSLAQREALGQPGDVDRVLGFVAVPGSEFIDR